MCEEVNFWFCLWGVEVQGSVGVLERRLGCPESLTVPETCRSGGGYSILGGMGAQRSIREWGRSGGRTWGTFWKMWTLKSQVKQEGGVSHGWERGRRGRRVSDDTIDNDSEPSASPWRAGFPFPCYGSNSLSLCFSRKRNRGKKKNRGAAPLPMTPWIFLPVFYPQEKQTPTSSPTILGNFLPLPPNEITSHSSHSCGEEGHWPLFSQPDSQLAHYQPVNPLTQHGHWSTS